MERNKKYSHSHPINKVAWIESGVLSANSYNPNQVFPPEMDLLKQSLLEDGWTQPLVIREDMEIVDGFYRWLLVKQDPEVSDLTGGLVPVVFLQNISKRHQIMSTIRHNRARGAHGLLKMQILFGN